MQTLIFLIIIVTLIIVASTKWKLHPFLGLILAALCMGFLSGMDGTTVLAKITGGFGNTLQSIGIVIGFGTIIGTFLEKSGGAQIMANSILQLIGEKRASLAMSITGFVVSIPVFCDSGFVILSPLNKALSRRTGISLAVFAVALATGLYATHVFVPPTPGPLAAAAELDADIGLVLVLGLVVSIPAAAVGWLWAHFYAKRFKIFPEEYFEEKSEEQPLPGKSLAFAPVIVPIILIALKSIAEYPTAPLGNGIWTKTIVFLGNPVTALFIGLFIAFALKPEEDGKEVLFNWVALGLRNAGSIILITGAGGAFGSVLRATDIGKVMEQAALHWHIGLLLPFIIAAVLKTAQGSSTVAIITTAALISPLTTQLGIANEIGKALAVLAIGAGAMTVSHLNDSYFWVVTKFSDMDTATALRSHTLATLMQGLISAVVIIILSQILM